MRHPRVMFNVSFDVFYQQILVSKSLIIKFLIQVLFSWFALIPVQALNIMFLIQVLFSWVALIPVQALNIKFLIQVLFSWFSLIPVQALNIKFLIQVLFSWFALIPVQGFIFPGLNYRHPPFYVTVKILWNVDSLTRRKNKYLYF